METETKAEVRMLPLYQALARCLAWDERATGEWKDRAGDNLRWFTDRLPHGSGIDSDLRVEWKGGKILVSFSFHHMNDGGFYDGWTDHTVTVKPSLEYGIELTVSGRDRNDIKDYLAETFDCALREMVPEYPDLKGNE